MPCLRPTLAASAPVASNLVINILLGRGGSPAALVAGNTSIDVVPSSGDVATSPHFSTIIIPVLVPNGTPHHITLKQRTRMPMGAVYEGFAGGVAPWALVHQLSSLQTTYQIFRFWWVYCHYISPWHSQSTKERYSTIKWYVRTGLAGQWWERTINLTYNSYNGTRSVPSKSVGWDGRS